MLSSSFLDSSSFLGFSLGFSSCVVSSSFESSSFESLSFESSSFESSSSDSLSLDSSTFCSSTFNSSFLDSSSSLVSSRSSFFCSGSVWVSPKIHFSVKVSETHSEVEDEIKSSDLPSTISVHLSINLVDNGPM